MLSSMLLPLIPMGIMLTAIYFIVWKIQRRGRYSPFTDYFLREPGETLRNKHREIQDELMESIFHMVIVGVIAVYFFRGFPFWAVIAVIVICTAFYIYQLKKVSRLFGEAVKVRLGFEGERATGQELTMLMRDGAWGLS